MGLKRAIFLCIYMAKDKQMKHKNGIRKSNKLFLFIITKLYKKNNIKLLQSKNQYYYSHCIIFPVYEIRFDQGLLASFQVKQRSIISSRRRLFDPLPPNIGQNCIFSSRGKASSLYAGFSFLGCS